MAEKVGSLVYTVELETGKLLEGQRKVDAALKKTGDEGDKLQARFTKVAAGITAALSAIAIEGVVSKIVTAQRQFDVMFASLKTMTGGADQAGAAFERLRQFAAETPYSLEQAVQGFVKLKALGLDPSERAMTSFGNTASAMGKDLSQMIEAVADASTSEFERLKEFGIKAKQEGDKVSLTFQGVTTKIGNNSAEITEYLTKIGETQFAGAMSERMKTLDGDISNLEDSLSALYLTVSQSGAGEAIAKGVRLATQAIQELSTSVKEGELTEYFDKLRPFVTAAEVAVVALAGSIAGRLVSAFIASAVQAYAAATAIGAASIAARGFTAILSTLGGPIGIAITGLALLALNWDKIGGAARDAATMSEEAAERIANAQRKGQANALKDLSAQLAEAKGEVADIDKELARTAFPRASDADLAELRARRETLVKIGDDIQKAMAKVTGAPGPAGGPPPPKPPPPPPKPPPPPPTATGPKGAKFDEEGYLAGLRSKTLEGLEAVAAIEQEALRRNAALLQEKKITVQTAAEAVNVIERNAATERANIQMAADEEMRAKIEADGVADIDLAKKLQANKAAATMMTAEDDPVARLQAEHEAKVLLLTQFAEQDLENAAFYDEQKILLEQQTADRIGEIKQRAADQQAATDQRAAEMAIAAAQGASGILLSMLQKAGKERTAIGKAAFLADKALAVANIIISTEQAAGMAMAQLGVYGIPMAAFIRGTGYASAAMVAGMAIGEVAGGRQYGGPTSSGSLYRVNETGQPEMFTAGNGNQYMMPTKDGRVTPANQVGGGQQWTINVNNAPPGTTATVNNEARVIDIAVARAVSEVNSSISSNSGSTWRALQSTTSVRPRQ